MLILLSRSVYNLYAVNQNNSSIHHWRYNLAFLSDKRDRQEDETIFFVFAIGAVFIWEILPVIIITIFFWVPKTGTQNYHALQAQCVATNPQASR